MKRALFPIVLTASLALTACGQGYSEEDLDLARETCETAVADKAKYPGGVKFVDSEETIETTEHNGVDLEIVGEVDFVNGFNVPTRYEYWCHVGANDGDTGKPEVKVEKY